MALYKEDGAGSYCIRTGFSLIELLITLLIVGILSVISYPSYQGYIQKSHRFNAEHTLQQLMDQVKDYHLQTGEKLEEKQLLLWLQAMELNKHGNKAYEYHLKYLDSGLWLLAKPIGNQSSDPCGPLFLHEKGIKGSKLSDGSCWNGKQNYKLE